MGWKRASGRCPKATSLPGASARGVIVQPLCCVNSTVPQHNTPPPEALRGQFLAAQVSFTLGPSARRGRKSPPSQRAQ
jgi:hypothetical protein